jgi:hypothetical protein
MNQRPIRAGDHLTMPAQVSWLPSRPAPRALPRHTLGRPAIHPSNRPAPDSMSTRSGHLDTDPRGVQSDDQGPPNTAQLARVARHAHLLSLSARGPDASLERHSAAHNPRREEQRSGSPPALPGQLAPGNRPRVDAELLAPQEEQHPAALADDLVPNATFLDHQPSARLAVVIAQVSNEVDMPGVGESWDARRFDTPGGTPTVASEILDSLTVRFLVCIRDRLSFARAMWDRERSRRTIRQPALAL